MPSVLCMFTGVPATCPSFQIYVTNHLRERLPAFLACQDNILQAPDCFRAREKASEAKQEAERAALEVSGVTRVINNLQVQP
ncbi:MAG: BON domain-containing protein [Acidobacteriaceae bacterium]|nr:BON domain-containing protein [Acidobacteriaceae bacterium]